MIDLGMRGVETDIRFMIVPERVAVGQYQHMNNLVFDKLGAIVAIMCMVILALSVYPGILTDVFFFSIFLSVVVVPIAGVLGLVVVIVLTRKGKLHLLTVPKNSMVTCVAILFLTLMLVMFHVPQRITFAMSRSSFEALVPNAPPPENDLMRFNRRVGIYFVDEYAADPRGGVYFRVHSGPDGIGPDRMSYGFVYRPNSKGTPFGRASYLVFGLGKEWYWFQASDDSW